MTNGGAGSERALRKAIAWLLAFTVAFMAYASLYPFDFDLAHFAALTREDWLRSLTWRPPPRTDAIANLIFYLPFGALLMYLTPRRWGAVRRTLCTAGGGAAVSLVMECAQQATLSRDCSITDVVLNTLSTAMAAVLMLGARGLGLQPSLPELRTRRPDLIALLVVALWLIFHGAPFMPSSRFVLYFPNPLRALDWRGSSAAFAGFFGGYVLVGATLRGVLRPTSFWGVFAACAAVSLLARIGFRGQRLELNELAGLLLALPVIWQLTREAEPHLYRRAALWVGPAFVFLALAPFNFSAASPNFDWWALPRLTVRLGSGEPGLLETAFFYIGAVWLLSEARLPLRRITIAMGAGALFIEVAHAWEPGRSAQLAAPLLVLAGTALVWLRRRMSPKSLPAA